MLLAGAAGRHDTERGERRDSSRRLPGVGCLQRLDEPSVVRSAGSFSPGPTAGVQTHSIVAPAAGTTYTARLNRSSGRGGDRLQSGEKSNDHVSPLIIPMCIILNRLENSRSRRKVSVDGFKMINGHIVRRES